MKVRKAKEWDTLRKSLGIICSGKKAGENRLARRKTSCKKIGGGNFCNL